MVKKLKQMAQDKDDNQLARAVRESAQQIWLAGLGAFAKAREERTKVFEALAREGKSIQERTRTLAEERIGEVADKVGEVKDMVGRQASDSWDRLEQVFEDRVSRALERLGVPTSRDVRALLERVDALTASLEAMGAKVPAAKRKAGAGKTGSAGAKAAKGAKAAGTTGSAGKARAAKAARGARATTPAASIADAVQSAPAKATRAPRASKAARSASAG